MKINPVSGQYRIQRLERIDSGLPTPVPEQPEPDVVSIKLNLNVQPKMKLVAITDIFGKTSCLDALINELSPCYSSTVVIDPYGGVDQDFPGEEEAYRYFQRKAGLEDYGELVLSRLKQIEEPVHCLGFSIGASALWTISDRLQPRRQMRAMCFYSSQVRNLLHITPNFEITFYFPIHEPFFEVEEVVRILATKPNVRWIGTPYLHGFMNRKSVNFNENGYKEYLQQIRSHARAIENSR